MELEKLSLKNVDFYQATIANIPEKIATGDCFKAVVHIQNNSQVVFRRVKITIDCPYMLGTTSSKWEIKRIEPNEQQSVEIPLIAVHGGRDFLRLLVTITELFDTRPQILSLIMSVSGKGLYRGDNHTHSTRSDGQNNNSVFDNAKRVRADRALSWITPTDHCSLNTLDCDEINRTFTDFIAFPHSGEYGQVGRTLIKGHYPEGKIGEHGLQYQVKYVNNRLTDGRQWQDIVNETIAQGGLFYLAHPFSPSIWWDYEEAFNLERATGIEVWQGDYHPLDEPNRMAFDLWDKMNSIGKKLVGIANSDGHFLHRTGHPFIMGNMDELSVANIYHVLQTGCCYGSNGVHIRFRIADQENNQTVYIKKKKMVKFNIHIFDTVPILNIKILQNKSTKKPQSATIFREYILKENINHFIEEFEAEVNMNEFYRLEVITKEGTIGPGAFLGDYYGLGFGFTNPIYIAKANKNCPETVIEDLIDDEYLEYTKSGYPYYNKEEGLSLVKKL
ncbi:MAG: hypothetical protein PHF85_04660 [Bacilli bacterium]|nr:hypothetical protein [Bacilli bacterium]